MKEGKNMSYNPMISEKSIAFNHFEKWEYINALLRSAHVSLPCSKPHFTFIFIIIFIHLDESLGFGK